MLSDEQGEYYGVKDYVIKDIDSKGKCESYVPLTIEQYQNIEKRNLYSYPQFNGADAGFLAYYNDSVWEKIGAYLEENPHASYWEVEDFINKKIK